MKNITLAIIVVLAGCASENIHPTHATPEKIYHTQTSSVAGLAVLVSRSARIEGAELVWSCVYQTAEGQVVVEQREECKHTP